MEISRNISYWFINFTFTNTRNLHEHSPVCHFDQINSVSLTIPVPLSILPICLPLNCSIFTLFKLLTHYSVEKVLILYFYLFYHIEFTRIKTKSFKSLINKNMISFCLIQLTLFMIMKHQTG